MCDGITTKYGGSAEGNDNKDMPVMLWRRRIETAKSDRSHTAIKTLDDMLDRWGALNDSLKGENDCQKQQKLCAEAFVPFAEALEGQAFTLKPLEIVSIWSRAMELFPESIYARCRLSASLICVYGTAGTESQKWEHLFKKINENSRYLRDMAHRDMKGANRFIRRLFEINRSLKALDYYLYGTRGDLTGGIFSGLSTHMDVEGGLSQIISQKEWHTDALLSKISEEWADEMTIVSVQLQDLYLAR